MRRPAAATVAVAALALAVVPLGFLAYFSIHLSSSALRHNVELRVASTGSILATLVESDANSVVQVTQGYTTLPAVHRALAGAQSPAASGPAIRAVLHELRLARPGIAVAFLTTPAGRLVAVDPPTPMVVGEDFSFRDWYRGVTRTGHAYVSRAYVSRAAGRPRVVAAAIPVRAAAGGPVIGILVAAYQFDRVQGLVDDLFRNDGIRVTVTDRYGVPLAEPGRKPGLVSRRDDPLVAAALAGRTGIGSFHHGALLAAFRPIPSFGWTVSASVPASTALAKIGTLQLVVASIAAGLVVLLLLGAVAIGRTWSRRTMVENALSRQAAINRAVLAAARDTITMEGPDGALVFANARTRELGAELFGAPELELTDEEIAARLTEPERYLDERRAEHENPDAELVSEYELVGSHSRFLRYSAPVNDEEGRRLGRIVTLRDITSEREAEQLKIDLVATVSHELRTPLTGVLGFAELLQRPDLDAKTRAGYAATIHSEATRLTLLINDFLDLQRIEAGALTLGLEALDLRTLIEHAVAAFPVEGTDHRFDLDLPDLPIDVAVDPRLITQVLANLLSNAIKYSPEGGTIRVSALLTDGAARVEISDPGVGIPADQQRRLFTKFFRVDSTDTRAIGGTGLGLALAREIVEAHGGRIGVESVEGEGSTFWFELVRGVPAGGPRPHILIVEDDPAAGELLVSHLGQDFESEIARTGTLALERAQQRPPNVICLDAGLAGAVTSWTVLATLKGDPRTARIPVLVCGGVHGRARAEELGATGYLTKPVTQAALLAAIRGLLRGQGADVLVVDDDATVRMLITATLADDGHTIREAADGLAALQAVVEHRPDAIILDLLMPGLGGLGVLERLHEDPDLGSIPVILLSAGELTPAERQTLDRYGVALLEKSEYSAAELRRLVDQALGRQPESVA